MKKQTLGMMISSPELVGKEIYPIQILIPFLN